MKLYINKLIKRRNKYNVKYQSIIGYIFQELKKRLNDPSLFYAFISNSNDFIFIDEFIKSKSNKIYTKISQFLINMNILLKSSHKIFCDYLELLNNLIKSFFKDNKNTFNIESVLPNKLVMDLNSILKSNNIRKKIEKADTQLVYMQIDGYSGKEVLYEEIIFPRNRQFLVTARRIRDLNVTQVILKEIDPIMNLQYQRRNVDEEYWF